MCCRNLARAFLLFLVTSASAGCVFDGLRDSRNEPKPETKEEAGGKPGLFGKVGGWIGRDGKKDKEGGESGTATNPLPVPQKLPIGSVHLVHRAGGFVLIRTGRTTEVDPSAELVTYDEGGRPTGKLRLSPERKGAFLAADIVEGNPQANDRVVMFGYLDQKGSFRLDASDPDQPEVLE